MIASLDPNVTVTPQVMASNLLVMGSLPPRLTAADVAPFRAEHGAPYADAVLSALRGYGITVDEV